MDSTYDDEHSSFKIALVQRAYESAESRQCLLDDYCEDITISVRAWSKASRIASSTDDFVELLPQSYDNSATVWVASHSRELHALYPGLWILVKDNSVVGSSANPLELQRLADTLQIDAPFITRVAAVRPKTGASIYANKII